MNAYLNRIATAVPPHDVHRKFVSFAPTLLSREQDKKLFARMAERGADRASLFPSSNLILPMV